MHRMRIAAAVGAALALAAGPTHAASCGDDVAGLERKLNNQGASAAAAQSSGQKDAAARASKSIEAKQTDTPVAALPKPPEPGNMAGTKEAAAAGTAGEDVMAAKVSLNDAKNADRKGDEAACRAAVERARRQAGL